VKEEQYWAPDGAGGLDGNETHLCKGHLEKILRDYLGLALLQGRREKNLNNRLGEQVDKLLRISNITSRNLAGKTKRPTSKSHDVIFTGCLRRDTGSGGNLSGKTKYADTSTRRSEVDKGD